VARDAEGRLTCAVVLRHRGRRVRVATYGRAGGERWLRLDELEAALGIPSGERVRWLLGDPSSPCADAVSAVAGAQLPPLTRLARLVKPDRADLMAVVAFAVATGVLLLATPIAVQALVNFVALGGAIQQLVVVALFLFLALGFAGVMSALQNWVVEILQRRIFVRLVAELAGRLPRIRQKAFDEGYGPELVNRFFDVITIQKVSSYLLLDGLSVALSVVVGTIVLAFYHPILLAFDIVLLATIALIVLWPARHGMRTAIEESSSKYAVEAWLEDLARNPLAFKTAGARRWAQESSDRLASRYVRNRARHYRVVFGQILGAVTLQVVASTALLAIGGWLVINETLTLGQLVAAELIVTTVVSSVAKMGKHLESFYDLTASVHKLGTLLDLPTERLGGEHHGAPRGARGSALRLADVTWLLPNGEPLFADIAVELPPGGNLGITGHSGSGKSTLVELIWGLRRPSSGHVQLDGRDVRDLSLDSLRHTIAVASRIEIVTGTLRENVRLGRPFVDDEAVREALRTVGLLDRLSQLPEGLETPMHTVGHPLSEGEIRLLMIARAIAGGPSLLVVEDLLDGLSAERRQVVLPGLLDPAARWSLVLVSTLPEVLERCDQVLEMPDGTLRVDPDRSRQPA
jgi:ABC-type bacteriocin/lantibiotic exporter with double-glycine peptidase domain